MAAGSPLAVVCVLVCLCGGASVSGMTIQQLAKSFNDVDLYIGSTSVSTDTAGLLALIEKLSLESVAAGISAFERLYVTFFLIHLEKKIVAASGNTLDRLDLLDLLSPNIDIVFDPTDVEKINKTICEDKSLLDLSGNSPAAESRRKRKVTSDLGLKWPTNTIPYSISEDFEEGGEMNPYVVAINAAIAHWEQETCLRFVKVDDEGEVEGAEGGEEEEEEEEEEEVPAASQSRIVFRQLNGCWSYLGKKNFPQIVSLGQGCGSFSGVVIKLIGHALGFWNEQQRPDRDNFISVNSSNIQLGNWNVFLRRGWSEVRLYGVPYDYASLYHYQINLFENSNRRPTLLPLDMDFISTLGPKDRLSFFDAKLANLHYCQASCGGSLKSDICQNKGYKDPNDCSKCKCPEGLTGNCTEPAEDVNVDCGENNLVATPTLQTLESPGFGTTNYSANEACAWLITTEGENTRIEVVIQEIDMNCNQLCRDYLEVRVNTLAQSGPRFCCDIGEPKTFVSTGNQVLINYRTLFDATTPTMGFRLTYRKVNCGGCTTLLEPRQETATPCVTTESYSCQNSYLTTCTSGDPPVTTSCVKFRNNTCYRENQTCCLGYTLEGDSCIRVGDNVTDWGPYSTCTRSCGGCGTQFRTRGCLIDSCSEQLVETRSCNPALCPIPTTQTYVVSRRAICGWWSSAYCIRYSIAIRQNRCCGEWSESDGVCGLMAQ